MAAPRHVHLRSARDRLFDLLGSFGKTAPLRDIPVLQDGLIVPHGGRASITVDPGQVDVRYLLRHRDGSTVGSEAGHATGNGAATAIATPPVTEDITYKVLARKTLTQREAYLHDVASIRVGLDTGLPARIVADPLVPSPTEPPADSDPRIVDYDSVVTVQVDGSQEGVDYELVVGGGDDGTWEPISSPRVTGTGDRIEIASQPMHEDAVIRVRASREFDPSEGMDPQVDVLDAVLPLAVRADPARAAAIAEQVVDHGGAAAMEIAGGQATAAYSVYGRRLTPADFVYGEDPGPAIAVEVPGEPTVRVRHPATGVGLPPEPYAPLATAEPGGGRVTVAVEGVTEDMLLVVVAAKDHGGVPSHVRLDAASAVLARPDPEPGLSFTGTVRAGRLVRGLRVAGGQPGVFYYVRPGADGPELPLAAYFPEPGEGEAEPGRGVGELRIGVDFVVAHDATEGDPVVDLGGELDLPVEFHLRAVKARTRLAAAVGSTLRIPARPAVSLASSDVITGTSAHIVVAGSISGEVYQVFVGGEPLGGPLAGSGDGVSVLTGPLSADAAIVVEAGSAPSHRGFPIRRRYELFVTVWPPVDARVDAPPLDPGATGPADPRVVDHGTRARVVITDTAPGVDYRVVGVTADGITDMSEPAGGGGATLTITTPPLAEDAVLAVRTTREVHLGHGTEARGLVHEPFLPVAVRANRAPGLAAGSALVGHGEEGSLEVAASQASARYAVYARPLTDADLFPAGSDPTRTVDIGDRQLTVRSPWPDGRDAALPAGFSVITAPAPGTDGGLALALGPRQEDALLVVTASKDHGGGVTTVVLQPLLAVFVRPDPAPDLRLAALLADGMLAEALLSGGEPGVRYHLRARGARRDASDLPAYFHRPDPADPARHPGVGDLRLGHDLVIARGADAEGRALDPLLPMYRPLGLPVELRVRAVRIGTEAEVQLDATALVAAVPDIGVEPGRLEPGSSATIEVRASVAGEVYEPRRDGAAIAPARPGDGGDLSFETGPLDGDAVFVVAVTELEQAGIAVERRVTLPVEVG